mmetsp:Transcript_35257/g.63400  ORF Transcript_35257/g.63400 Transcript_35257/m.63400 type:complete len:122 (+) Transcript_35257:1-366(+)
MVADIAPIGPIKKHHLNASPRRLSPDELAATKAAIVGAQDLSPRNYGESRHVAELMCLVPKTQTTRSSSLYKYDYGNHKGDDDRLAAERQGLDTTHHIQKNEMVEYARKQAFVKGLMRPAR